MIAADPFALALWVVMGVGLSVYAVTGGADFGAGLWSLLATGPRRKQQRETVDHAIAPIWEANHVWLIFVIVVMFAAFPRAYATLLSGFYLPVMLLLACLIGRAVSIEFRSKSPNRLWRAYWDFSFFLSSSEIPAR